MAIGKRLDEVNSISTKERTYVVLDGLSVYREKRFLGLVQEDSGTRLQMSRKVRNPFCKNDGYTRIA